MDGITIKIDWASRLPGTRRNSLTARILIMTRRYFCFFVSFYPYDRRWHLCFFISKIPSHLAHRQIYGVSTFCHPAIGSWEVYCFFGLDIMSRLCFIPILLMFICSELCPLDRSLEMRIPPALFLF